MLDPPVFPLSLLPPFPRLSLPSRPLPSPVFPPPPLSFFFASQRVLEFSLPADPLPGPTSLFFGLPTAHGVPAVADEPPLSSFVFFWTVSLCLFLTLLSL